MRVYGIFMYRQIQVVKHRINKENNGSAKRERAKQSRDDTYYPPNVDKCLVMAMCGYLGSDFNALEKPLPSLLRSQH